MVRITCRRRIVCRAQPWLLVGANTDAPGAQALEGVRCLEYGAEGAVETLDEHEVHLALRGILEQVPPSGMAEEVHRARLIHCTPARLSILG